jgi:hypothetical protein
MSVLGSAMLVGSTIPAANADHDFQHQDGLVNVMVGDIKLKDTVDVNVAAQVAAEICGVTVQNVAVLANEVDQTGEPATICRTDQGDVRITQNN